MREKIGQRLLNEEREGLNDFLRGLSKKIYKVLILDRQSKND